MEQIEEWIDRLARLPEGNLKLEMRDAMHAAGWVSMSKLTETVANAVLDAWESRLDDVEALEQAAQHPDPPPPDPFPSASPVPYPRWKADDLRAELTRRGHEPAPETRKLEMISMLYELDADRSS